MPLNEDTGGIPTITKPFTDDDLKQLKKQVSAGVYIYDETIIALIARLDAAESLNAAFRHLNISFEYDENLERINRADATWRQTAGQ